MALTAAARPVGLLVLGHGAGGGVDAPDLRAVALAAAAAGWSVATVEQPWLLAGRRIADPPSRLDAAWSDVVPRLRLPRRPLVVGGRSAGARVACRTAGMLQADAVLALAFPLMAPSGRSRLPELLSPDVPTLVVQGARDRFGVPVPAAGLRVHVVAGADHAFNLRRQDGRTPEAVLAELAVVVRSWLDTITH